MNYKTIDRTIGFIWNLHEHTKYSILLRKPRPPNLYVKIGNTSVVHQLQRETGRRGQASADYPRQIAQSEFGRSGILSRELQRFKCLSPQKSPLTNVFI